MLDKHPEKLLALEGLGQKRCDLVARSWADRKAERIVVNFLIDHGVSSELAVKIVRTYGNETVRIVKEDPYRLVRDLRRIDFHWADTFAKSIGLGAHSAVRARAGIDYVLHEVSTGLGNCFLPRADLETMTSELLGVPKRVIAKAVEAEIEKGTIAVSDIPNPESLYPAELLRAEEGVAREIRRLASGTLPWGDLDLDGGIDAAQGKLGFALTRTQRNAVVTALSSKMSVLAGGPGMEKTSILKTILSILDAEGVKIRLCAPSRNAADRLSEVMGRVAIGVPSLLEFNGADETFRRNADHPVDCDLIVVCESSLLDILFAHRLLAALPSHAAVLFAGDDDLPASYGPGNFFLDLIDSQVVPVTKLSVVVQDGPAGWIAKVAHQIRSGEVPQFPGKADDGNCYFLRVDDEEELPPTAPLPDDAGTWTNDDPYAVFHLCGKYSDKDVSQMVWHRLAQHLTNKGLRLAFTGGGGEVEGKRIADVARFLPKGSYRKFSGALSFGQTAELLPRAALYVGVDTSTTHVAAAVGVPVLALFGPTSACHWGPAPSAGSRNFATT